MKPPCTFHFADEPQFRTTSGRLEMANRLRSYRNARGNMGCRIYNVMRCATGIYAVTHRYPNSPTAIITTR